MYIDQDNNKNVPTRVYNLPRHVLLFSFYFTHKVVLLTCLCTMCVHAHGGRKRASIHLTFESQSFVSCHMDDGNQIRVINDCSSSSNHLSSPNRRGLLIGFTVPYVTSLPQRRPQIQSESGCLFSKYTCCNYTSELILPGSEVLLHTESQLSKTICGNSSLKGRITTSSTIQNSSQRGSIQPR